MLPRHFKSRILSVKSLLRFQKINLNRFYTTTTMSQQKDHWSTASYQNSASFVPKLAGKVTQWLDLQKDDVVLDIGCGDGILNAEFAKVLSQGSGSVHGIDSSPAMIEAAQKLCKDLPSATFEVLDGNKIHTKPELQNGKFNKAFSNAAMHWILRQKATRDSFFKDVYAALAPGGTFAFEMGGLGNVSEMRTALLLTASSRIGAEAAHAADPWFFGDEEWAKNAMEKAGFRVDKVEREWRPTTADAGGVEGWLRLFGSMIIDAVPEDQRDAMVKEAVAVLKEVCKKPDGGEMISYVRLRALATKI